MRILIVDDHAVIRKGIRQIILEEYPSADISEAGDAGTAIAKTIRETFDLVVSDLSMPGRSGLELVHAMKQNHSHAPVLILSIYPEEQYAIRALKAGAAGYLNKEAVPEELIKAIQKVLQGRRYISPEVAERMVDQLNESESIKLPHETLSDREFDVFKMIAAGKTVKEISDLLLLNVTTVSTYRARTLAKLHVKNNADLTRYAIENNILIQA